jgi:hypothetical protein
VKHKAGRREGKESTRSQDIERDLKEEKLKAKSNAFRSGFRCSVWSQDTDHPK